MRNLMAVLVIALLLFGCAQQAQQTPPAQNTGGSGGTGGGSGAAPNLVIHIKNFAFDPAQASVKQGDTVQWVNDDGVTHSIKAAGFASPNIPSGGTYTHKFTEPPGDYAYSCGIHPSMQGTVTVQ